MRHLNLFCAVGRAAAQAVGTFDYADPKRAETDCDAAQSQKSADLSRSGVDPARVKFSRVYVDDQGKGHASPAVAVAQPKKGKK